MFWKRLQSRDDPAQRSARAPEGSRLYAVGDIHGRVDLLRGLHDRIRDDADGYAGRRALIYLGDYVDRGDGSRQVIELLLDDPLDGFEIILLMGNHEEMMSSFLEDASIGQAWLINGGDTTLLSYGVDAPADLIGEQRIRVLQQAFNEALPTRHRGFLRALSEQHTEGDYLFAHAGVRPGVAPDQQDRQDLLWIREPFLSSRADHGHCVVHGHTTVKEPEFHANRIAIDTGAYYSDTLTCLVLEDVEQRVIQT
ncbi:MAG: metallophosphoesterase family protein [Alphaproteobacteria bacterium]